MITFLGKQLNNRLENLLTSFLTKSLFFIVVGLFLKEGWVFGDFIFISKFVERRIYDEIIEKRSSLYMGCSLISLK
jgi:hypothetical protein